MFGLKICGVRRSQDLRACVELGVDAVGINLWPGSSRYIDPVSAKALLDELSSRPTGPELSSRSGSRPELPTGAMKKVGVFVDPPIRDLELAILMLGFDLIQLHGDAAPEPYARLAEQRKVGWIWVVRGMPDLETLRVPEPAPAWVLLDSAVDGFGGAGRTTDWDWAADAVRRLSPLPVWLAGGIRPDNASAALAHVRPAGIDVASGSETSPGIKSRDAIASLRAICQNLAT